MQLKLICKYNYVHCMNICKTNIVKQEKDKDLQLPNPFKKRRSQRMEVSTLNQV